MAFSLEIDSRAFEAGGSRFVSALAASAESALRSVAGDAVVEMAMVTPPGSPSVRGESALARGRASVLAGALAVVRPVPGVVGAEPVASVVRRYRRAGGRTPRIAHRVVVSRADFEAYIEAKTRRVGYTAGGFHAAAQALGRSLPGWIADDPGPGSIRIVAAGDEIAIEVANEVPWFGSLRGMGARMDAVMQRHADPLAHALARAWDAAKAAGGFV